VKLYLAKKFVIDEPDEELRTRPYDVVQLYEGYRADRKGAKVEILCAEIILLTDEFGQLIVCEEKGVEYVQAIIEYRLGKILESNFLSF
jgi:hypothetical protein